MAGEEIGTVNFVLELQEILCHQRADESGRRIIYEQEDLAGAGIPGVPDPGQDFLQDLTGKRIEKVDAVHFIGNLVFFRRREYKFRTDTGYGFISVDHGCTDQSGIVVHPDTFASQLPGQKEIHPSLSAAVIQQQVPFADQPAAGQPLQDRIRRRFIWIPVLVRV